MSQVLLVMIQMASKNNLMPCGSKVASGELIHLNIFGVDYVTCDSIGGCDYIHVKDFADCDMAAISYLKIMQALLALI